MKTNARLAYALSLALAPMTACGDDGDADDETTAADASSSEASPTTGDDPTTGANPTTGADPTTSADPTTGDPASTGAADASSSGEDPFAGCSRDVLEEDFGVIDPLGMPGPPRWYGPGAAEDGTLLDDGETEYIVSVTYLALDPGADFELLDQLNAANAQAVFTNPGMVAVQLGGSASCGSLRTFTVWADEGAMMDFVSSKAHQQSIAAFPMLSRGGSTLSLWEEPVLASEITWEAAMERIAAAETYD